MIGSHYRKNSYNCAHFVSDWYLKNKGIKIPVVNEFGISFMIWMRRNFKEVTKPSHASLVFMTLHDNKTHIGVYDDGYVIHNYKASTTTNGSVVKMTTGQIKREYKKVSFWQWSQ